MSKIKFIINYNITIIENVLHKVHRENILFH